MSTSAVASQKPWLIGGGSAVRLTPLVPVGSLSVHMSFLRIIQDKVNAMIKFSIHLLFIATMTKLISYLIHVLDDRMSLLYVK